MNDRSARLLTGGLLCIGAGVLSLSASSETAAMADQVETLAESILWGSADGGTPATPAHTAPAPPPPNPAPPPAAPPRPGMRAPRR